MVSAYLSLLPLTPAGVVNHPHLREGSSGVVADRALHADSVSVGINLEVGVLSPGRVAVLVYFILSCVVLNHHVWLLKLRE